MTDFVLEAKVQAQSNYPTGTFAQCLATRIRLTLLRALWQADRRSRQPDLRMNDALWLKISTKTTPGTNWNDDWHNVKVVHIVDGTIEVYFGDKGAGHDCHRRC